jgi:hypothetical protein
MNRRHAIKLLSTVCASGIILQRLPAISPASDSGELRYGLLFGVGDLPRIRANFNRNPLFAEFRDELVGFDKAAEVEWMETELRHNDQLFDIARLGRTAESMAFLFLMTGDEAAFRLARRAIREIMKFERWDFFLDGDRSIAVQRGSSSTVATALVADFLGDRLSGKERREWLRTMGERGCEACYLGLYGIRNPQEVVGWRFDPESTFYEHRPYAMNDQNRRPEITEDTNLRAVPASALVIGAAVYQLEFGESETTSRWLEMGRFSSKVFRDVFQPDGSYHEEVNYANYTALHLQQAAIIFDRLGDDGLMDLIHWDNYVDFQLNMTMPTHLNPVDIVNWGDSGARPSGPRPFSATALPMWVASVNGNALAQWYAENLAGKHTFWSVIWYDPAVKAEPPAPGPRLYVSDLDRVVARTGFGLDDFVVAMRSGPPANHEHADRNSLIVKCFGERMITDPKRPPYNWKDPSWALRLTKGHSAVLVDGRGHEYVNGVEGTNPSRAYARITKHEGTPQSALWSSDATQPYRLIDTEIRQVLRTVAVFYEEKAVVVVDRFAKYEKPSTFTARFIGYNPDGELGREVTSEGFVLTRPHGALQATIHCSVGTNILAGTLDIAPDRAAENPFVDVVTAPCMEARLITVMSLARQPADAKVARFSEEGGEMLVEIGKARLRVGPDRCRVVSALQ